MKLNKVLGAASFAHLLGFSAKRAEEEDKREDDEESKRAKKASRAEEDDDEEDDEDKDGPDSRRADNGDDDDKADDVDADADDEEDDDEDKDKKSKRAKKAKRAEDEDDEGEEAKAARKSERARCAAIFSCDAAGVRPDLAAHLAFNTGMPKADAIALLKAAAVGEAPKGRRGLGERMSSVKTPIIGGDGSSQPDASGPKGVAAAMTAVYNKLRP